MNPFGLWLKQQRTRRGWSQRAFAARAQVTHASISRFEGGERHPSRDMARLLADTLAEGLGDEIAAQLRRAAWLTAGYAPDEDIPQSPEEAEALTPSITYEPDPELSIIIEGYHGLDPAMQETARAQMQAIIAALNRLGSPRPSDEDAPPSPLRRMTDADFED
jgi:transcriptional regulator with XRE-family HTH domain